MHVAWICLVAGFAVPAVSMQVNFYQGEGCRSTPLGPLELIASDDCHQDFVGEAKSAVIRAGDEDSWSTVVFFESNECNPETIIYDGDSGCATPEKWWGSFAVWDVNPENFY
jgi:hypothetical protein